MFYFGKVLPFLPLKAELGFNTFPSGASTGNFGLKLKSRPREQTRSEWVVR